MEEGCALVEEDSMVVEVWAAEEEGTGDDAKAVVVEADAAEDGTEDEFAETEDKTAEVSVALLLAKDDSESEVEDKAADDSEVDGMFETPEERARLLDIDVTISRPRNVDSQQYS